MEANTTSGIGQQSETSSQSGSTNGSKGDYEFINPAEEVVGVGGDQLGAPIQIVKVSEERRFELDLDALSAILLRDSIRDKPVVVVSIVGELCKDKSLTLDFFLRYLQSGCGTTSDWLGDLQTPLKGFSWRGVSERNTIGILMWSEPFLVKLSDGKEVAVVLMDTQGVYGSEKTMADSVTMTYLSDLLSSIQVSIGMHFCESDENHNFLEISTNFGPLPINHHFDQGVDDTNSEFVDYLTEFVPQMFDPKNIMAAEIWGLLVTGKRLMEYFKVNINVFAGKTMPKPESMLEATVRADNLTAVATVKDSYVSAMEEICGGEKPLKPKTLKTKHKELRNEMIDAFDKIPKMGGKKFQKESYRRRLMMELNQEFQAFKAQNKRKKMFK